jgi:hypothetical protein
MDKGFTHQTATGLNSENTLFFYSTVYPEYSKHLMHPMVFCDVPRSNIECALLGCFAAPSYYQVRDNKGRANRMSCRIPENDENPVAQLDAYLIVGLLCEMEWRLMKFERRE